MPRLSARLVGLLGFSLVLLGIVWLVNQRDALWLAAGVLAIIALASLWTWLPLGKLSVTRSTEPLRPAADDPVTVRLHLTKPRWSVPGLLRMQENVPAELGPNAKFTVSLDPRAGWQRDISYQFSVPRRGRFLIGPLLADVEDALGLWRRRLQLGAGSELVVYPKTYEMIGRGASGSGQLADAQTPSAGMLSQEDILVRDYRIGDDVRRVHWRSTAKTGELMVRREEQANQPAVRIFFDNRASRHGEHEDSLEEVVSAAASIGVAARDSGYRVRIWSADGQLFDSEAALSHDNVGDPILESFVDVQLSPNDSLIDPTNMTGQINILVLANTTSADLTALQAVSTSGIAVVITGPDESSDADQPAQGRIAHEQLAPEQLAQEQLAEWRVIALSSAAQLPRAWRDALNGSLRRVS